MVKQWHYSPEIRTITKHVKAGDWVTLETVFNQRVGFYIKDPAGAWIRVRFWWSSFDEQRLDGKEIKGLGPSFGACQVKVEKECDVTYEYGPTGAPGPSKITY